jgi:hypothetical protein
MLYRMYEFLIVLFRLTNALANQQVHVNNMLQLYLYKFVVRYLNNVLIYTKGTWKDYIKKVKLVLREYKKRDMLFKLEKCIFFAKEIEFLKYVIITEGLCMQEHKIKKILK